MFTALLVATHVVAVGAGLYTRPHLSALYTAWKSSRMLKDAKALVAKAEADAKALDTAKKVVAAAPVVVVTATGPTGATGTH